MKNRLLSIAGFALMAQSSIAMAQLEPPLVPGAPFEFVGYNVLVQKDAPFPLNCTLDLDVKVDNLGEGEVVRADLHTGLFCDRANFVNLNYDVDYSLYPVLVLKDVRVEVDAIPELGLAAAACEGDFYVVVDDVPADTALVLDGELPYDYPAPNNCVVLGALDQVNTAVVGKFKHQ